MGERVGKDEAVEEREIEPVQVDPRPDWIPFLVIFGLVVPFLALMVLGAILFA